MGLKELLKKYVASSVEHDRKNVLEGKTLYYENQKGKLWYRMEEILQQDEKMQKGEELQQEDEI